MIQPGTSYQYHTLDAHFPDDWICFETEEKAPLPSVLTCNLPLQLEHFDRCASLIWQILMENTASDFTPPPQNSMWEDNIKALFFVLQNHLAQASRTLNGTGGTSPYLQKFRSLRRQIQNAPGEAHTITRYAASFCMSTSHFQHLYSQFFGISFQNDLIRMRISHAQKLLSTTCLSTEQIAEACGYSNSTHFFRQFKKMTGSSPAKCRREERETW